MKRDFVSIADLSPKELAALLEKAAALKKRRVSRALQGKKLAMIFQKPSLRTRVSFEIAMTETGGHALYLSPDEVGMGKREPPEDVARVLSRYVDGIVARTFAHRDIEALARHATVPVVNALSDAEHPCQAMADLLTVRERKGTVQGKVIAFVGDGNNVANSLLLGSAMLGACFRIASPQGYQVRGDVLGRAKAFSGAVESYDDPAQAVGGADVVYTDVWTSMGQEQEMERRRRAFAPYQVTPQLLALARPDAVFMHPLPAHRGEEVAPGMLEHPASVVFDQAENRLHAQKALLLDLLGGGPGA